MRHFRRIRNSVFGETIANPALTVFDFEKFAKAAHAHHVPLIIDNTFATPINCRPFEWGADIVTHSTTKYMDGHAACVEAVQSLIAVTLTGLLTETSLPDLQHRMRLTMESSIQKNLEKELYNKSNITADERSWIDPVSTEMHFF